MKKTLTTCFFCALGVLSFAQNNNPLQRSTQSLSPTPVMQQEVTANPTKKIITQSTYNSFSTEKKAMIDAHPEIYLIVEDEASKEAANKKDLYENAPEVYNEMYTTGSNAAIITIKREDYEQLPAKKKAVIDAQPERYNIVD